ncbi:MAG: cyclopropane-fatty-acyl-phospholipid synthase family protein [Ketobacter sp.]
MNMIDLAERGWIPDTFIRYGIRRLCESRLKDEQRLLQTSRGDLRQLRFDDLRQSAIAIETAAANEQHYEIPAQFYQYALGPHLKYSACLWGPGTRDLGEAEAAMLALYCERAELEDGQDILELGCGWGSLTLWMAARYPNARITAVSNSHSQKQHIDAMAQQRHLNNIKVITCDVNDLTLDANTFDRAVSIEMFEHVRNYEQLLNRVSDWLRPAGQLFVHIFCHRHLIYPFETEGDDNWMGRYFFTGGQMPALDTFAHFDRDLQISEQWFLEGTHYEKTAQAWLDNMDVHRDAIRELFVQTYGNTDAERWVQRWRMFFMSCAELFGYAKGSEWGVGHYRFRQRQ